MHRKRTGSLTAAYIFNSCTLGKVQEMANLNELGQEKAEKNLLKYSGKEETTQRRIQDLEAQRKEASDSVSKAQAEVDRLQKLPDIPEPPFQEELIRAQNAVPTAAEPGKGTAGYSCGMQPLTVHSFIEVGLLKKGKNILFGESKADIAARNQRLEDLKRRRDEYMDKAKKGRDADRRIAAERLDKARSHELELLKLIQAANAELANHQSQLANAKQNMAEAEKTLKRLGEEKLGLVRADWHHRTARMGTEHC